MGFLWESKVAMRNLSTLMGANIDLQRPAFIIIAPAKRPDQAHTAFHRKKPRIRPFLGYD